MPTTFRPAVPDQSLLFPPSPRDWLPDGHLTFFIADTVAALDLQRFYAVYEGDGRRNQPFDPGMMVTVLLYAYATGTFSSRRIARKLEEDIAYRVLAAGNFPAHRTIADFRRQHLAALEALFGQVVAIAREAGVIQLGALAVDGSKVKANASKHKAMSYGRMREEERRLR
jgi:transposase